MIKVLIEVKVSIENVRFNNVRERLKKIKETVMIKMIIEIIIGIIIEMMIEIMIEIMMRGK